jgi:hypothetical protein
MNKNIEVERFENVGWSDKYPSEVGINCKNTRTNFIYLDEFIFKETDDPAEVHFIENTTNSCK